MEKDKEKEEKLWTTTLCLRTRKDFCRKPPTPKKVQQFIDKEMQGRPTTLTGQYFVDYYNAHGWFNANGQAILNWRPMVRCWLVYREDMDRKQAARQARQNRKERRAERMRQNEQLSESRRADTERWLQEKAQHDATAVSYEEYLKMKSEK